MRLRVFAFYFFINCLCVSSLFSINIEFSGIEKTSGNPIRLDSVRVINHTINLDTMLYNFEYLNTIIYHYIITDIDDEAMTNNVFNLSLNYPNSFKTDTRFNIQMSSSDYIRLNLSDETGKNISSLNIFLDAGNHSFILNGAGLSAGVYFITAAAGANSQTIKVVKMGGSSGGSTSFVYEGNTTAQTNFKNRNILHHKNTFAFVGYAKGFFLDTITDIFITHDTTIVFGMERFLFPVEFHSFGIYYNFYQVDNESIYKIIDTVSKKFELLEKKIDTFGFTRTVNANFTNNKNITTVKGDTIRFSNIGTNNWGDEVDSTQWDFTLIIDRNRFIFKIIDFKLIQTEQYYNEKIYSHINNKFSSVEIPFCKRADGIYEGTIWGGELRKLKNLHFYHEAKYCSENPITVYSFQLLNILDYYDYSYVIVRLYAK